MRERSMLAEDWASTCSIENQPTNRCTRTAAKPFSFDASDFSNAGFAAGVRLQRRSVIFIVGRDYIYAAIPILAVLFEHDRRSDRIDRGWIASDWSCC